MRILISAATLSSYTISVHLFCAANIFLFIIFILCEMWFKIILLLFNPQTQRRPAKLLMQFCPCLHFFFLLHFYSDNPANSQWAIKDYSQSNKLYLLTKKQITKACKCFITAYHANIVQITAIDSNVKTLGEAEPECRRRRYEQEEVIKTGNPWWHKVLILPCAWICGFHLAIFSSVWLFLRLWDTAGIRCSHLCPDITFLIYVLPTETDWRYLLICELCKWNSP